MIQKQKPLWLEILKLALPLILSMTGLVLMQFVDALFLAWYSKEAIAAVVPAGMAATLIISPFQGTAMFTSTLVAHYVGARKPGRAFAATWQGIYFSVFCGLIVFLIGFAAEPLFSWVAHSEQIRSLEQRYFAILCWFSFSTICGSALSGFFSGRGHTFTLMVVQLAGLAANSTYYCLILVMGGFGWDGWSSIATVINRDWWLVLLPVYQIRQISGTPGGRVRVKIVSAIVHLGSPTV